jgi:hypothetical protein
VTAPPARWSTAAIAAVLAGGSVSAGEAGCAGASPKASAPHAALRETGLRAPDDPTVRPARLFPESLDEGSSLGHEPGKGSRAIVAGIRVASVPDGAIFAAVDRLPSTPASVVALPDRLGGGFLFALGKQLWRAPSWLAQASPIFVAPAQIGQVLVGLDRAYVRTTLGVLTAIDPRTGTVTDLGPLPASPSVSRVAALDAWRAVAIADLRGALVTLDAGSTWRPLPLPIDPSDVVAVDDSLAVGGSDSQ